MRNFARIGKYRNMRLEKEQAAKEEARYQEQVVGRLMDWESPDVVRHKDGNPRNHQIDNLEITKLPEPAKPKLNRILRPNRLKKALALVTKLQSKGITADLAKLMDRADWIKAASEAHVIPPSPDTVALVIETLRKAEGLA